MSLSLLKEISETEELYSFQNHLFTDRSVSSSKKYFLLRWISKVDEETHFALHHFLSKHLPYCGQEHLGYLNRINQRISNWSGDHCETVYMLEYHIARIESTSISLMSFPNELIIKIIEAVVDNQSVKLNLKILKKLKTVSRGVNNLVCAIARDIIIEYCNQDCIICKVPFIRRNPNIEKFCQQWPIRKLNMEGLPLNEENAKAITKHAKLVENITSDDASVDDAIVNMLPKRLRRLVLGTTTQLTNLSIQSLSKNLVSLHIEDFHLLTDEAAQHFPPHLIHLSLGNCTQITSQTIAALPRELLSLSLPWATRIDDLAIDNLPSKLEKLELMCSWQVSSHKVKSLPTTLRNLSVSYWTKLQSLDVGHFTSTLRTLDISGCNLLNDPAIERIPKNLFSLKLSYTSHWSPQCITNLSQNLTHLDLSYCVQIQDEHIQLLPTNLIALLIGWCHQLTNAAIPNIPSQVVQLSLTHLHKITDQGIKFLSPNMESLFLEGMTQLTDLAICNLPRKLKDLYLYKTSSLTEKSIDYLPPNLEIIDLRESIPFTRANHRRFLTKNPRLQIGYNKETYKRSFSKSCKLSYFR